LYASRGWKVDRVELSFSGKTVIWRLKTTGSRRTRCVSAIRGATTAEKLIEDKGLGAPEAVRVREYHPRKICENSDAKSCILVTTMLISGLHRT